MEGTEYCPHCLAAGGPGTVSQVCLCECIPQILLMLFFGMKASLEIFDGRGIHLPNALPHTMYYAHR